MESLEYVAAVRRRWVIIVISTMVGAILGLGVYALQSPQYAATAQLFVGAQTGDAADRGEAAFGVAQLAATRFASYSKLAESNRVVSEIEAQLGFVLPPEKINENLSLSGQPGSAMIEVQGTGSTPEFAARLANVAAVSIATKAQAIERATGGLATVTVADEAVANPKPITAGPVKTVTLGALLGLLVGLALAVLLHQFDTRIRRYSDIPSALELGYLGAIRNDSTDPGAGKTETATVTNQDDDVRALRNSLAGLPDAVSARVVGVVSPSPGDGRSTTAMQLARSLANAGEPTLLIDADLRTRATTERSGMTGAQGLWDVLQRRADLGSCLQQTDSSTLWVLPAGDPDIGTADVLGSQAMAELVRSVRNDYDHVVVDTSPLLGVSDASEYVRWLDGAIILCRFGDTTRAQISDAMSLLKRVGGQGLGVVLTRVPASEMRSVGHVPDPIRA